MYLQSTVCVAPVLYSWIVRTNIVVKTQTNKHTGWKHYHLAIAGDKYLMFESIVHEWTDLKQLYYTLWIERYYIGLWQAVSLFLATHSVMCAHSTLPASRKCWSFGGVLRGHSVGHRRVCSDSLVPGVNHRKPCKCIVKRKPGHDWKIYCPYLCSVKNSATERINTKVWL